MTEVVFESHVYLHPDDLGLDSLVWTWTCMLMIWTWPQRKPISHSSALIHRHNNYCYVHVRVLVCLNVYTTMSSLIQTFSFAGYLSGGEDYFSRFRSTTFGHKTFSGFDFRDGEKPAVNETKGIYSTHLFTVRAQKIITDHAMKTPDKVYTLLVQHLMQRFHVIRP